MALGDNGSKRKIDEMELLRLQRIGWTNRDIAEEFGVSMQAVRKARKRISQKTTMELAKSTARPLIRREINAMQQIREINENANLILAGVMEGLRVLETDDGWTHLAEDPKEAVRILGLIKSAKGTALSAMAEIRGQLELQLKIAQALYDVQAAEEFQKEVLDAIREVAPEVRDRILDKLRKRRAVRQAVSPD